MNSADEIRYVCPRCGLVNSPEQVACARCERRLEPVLIRRPGLRAGTGFLRAVFRVRSLMILVALMGVCLGALVQSPVLGLFLSMLVAPAVLWAWYATWVWRSRGTSLGDVDLLGHVLGGFFGALLVWTAAAIAWGLGGLVPVAAEFEIASFGFGVIPALVAAGATAYLLVRTSPTMNPDPRTICDPYARRDPGRRRQ
jgi:hypothetical protein